MTASEHYELLGPLATGGMAEVLLARRVGPRGFERLLAVKRILAERAQDPEYVRMFLDEARNAATLSHHRIVQVFDIEIRDGVVFYAMEYLHGQTLAALLGREPRPPLPVALAVGIAVAEGLHYAHERPNPLVHRDVAPSNVMVTYDGNIKLIDFGIAKAANNLSQTVFGTFKGRLGYASPEQCRCEEVDRRTDVYSLAIMLYEITLGRPAFAVGGEQQMIERMTEARIAPPRVVDPAYPAELEAIVMKGLSRDRAGRYPTAADLQRDLEAFARRSEANMSDRTIARLMGRLFVSELEPWNRARETGVSLEEHVVRETLSHSVHGHVHDSVHAMDQDPDSVRPTLRADVHALATVDLQEVLHESVRPLPRPVPPSGMRLRRRMRRPRVLALQAVIVIALVVAGYAVARWLVG